MRDTVRAAREPVPAASLAAGGIALAAVAALAAVWILQARGYTPCELCLKERVPYYAAAPLAALLALAAPRLPPRALGWGFALLALLFAAGAGLGAYHAGVEWKLWPGPAGCSGAVAAPPDVGDFLKQLQTVAVVRCDAAALTVFGLSLAAWNALLALGLAGAALAAGRVAAA